jgi:hypothetical protein
MGQSQDTSDTTREYDTRGPVVRPVAPGVYFASDGILTADSLESAIAYLRGLAEPGKPGS